MRFYTVPRIGTGTDEDPFRPDVPSGIAWVGQTDGVDFIIATPADLDAHGPASRRLPEQAVENAATARGIRIADVQRWRVGGQGWEERE